jgi:hypothetical protein
LTDADVGHAAGEEETDSGEKPKKGGDPLGHGQADVIDYP